MRQTLSQSNGAGSGLSQSVQDYLKAIYKLGGDDFVAKRDIAAIVDVSPASVSNMIQRMADMDLVAHQSYKGVRLTKRGRLAALEIIRHHRLLETYLKRVMGHSWHQMHEEAERLEHHISEAFEDKIDEMLGYPTHDPHGHPIPSADGEISVRSTRSLAAAERGETVTVDHIADEDPDVLTYLEEIGLMPRAQVVVVDKAPFDGPVTVRIQDCEQVIGHRIASDVFILDRIKN